MENGSTPLVANEDIAAENNAADETNEAGDTSNKNEVKDEPSDLYAMDEQKRWRCVNCDLVFHTMESLGSLPTPPRSLP